MIWGGRWEGGSGLVTHVHLWLIYANVWQNQYSIVKQNKVKIKIKKQTNILNKLLANWIQEYIKRIIHNYQLEFVPGAQGRFKIHKSM